MNGCWYCKSKAWVVAKCKAVVAWCKEVWNVVSFWNE